MVKQDTVDILQFVQHKQEVQQSSLTTMDKIANKSPIQQYLVFGINGNTNFESETLGMKKLEYCDTLNGLE